MDLRERQKMRKLKRRRKRRLILLAILAVIALIVGSCCAFSGKDKQEELTDNQPIIEQELPGEQEVEDYPDAVSTVEDIVAAMSLDDKIMQLFVVRADNLTGVTNSTIYGATTKKVISEKPVGGVVYHAGNMENKQQLEAMISNTQQQYTEENGFPLFIIAEEEGGANSPIANSFGVNAVNIKALSEDESFTEAQDMGAKVGKYMKELKFNMNFAPNLAIGDSESYFSDDPETVSTVATAYADGMLDNGVVPVYKSFPGVVMSDTLEALKVTELLPFQTAINAGAKMIMVSSDRAPVLTGNNEPCYSSYIAVTDTLRGELGFSGVIITAPLLDDATAVTALEAGCDMLYMPKDLSAAVAAIKKAVEEGRISEERINESVIRIIDLKLSL